MNIIRKYKKTFMMVIILALVVSVVPVIGLAVFGALGSGSIISIKEETEILDSSQITDIVKNDEEFVYEALNLKMDHTIMLNQPDYEENGTFRTTLSSNFSESTTEQVILYEAFLTKGTTIRLDYRASKQDNLRFEFAVVDKDGIVQTFKGTDTKSLTVEEDGNYAIVYNANQYQGNYYLDVRLSAPTE